MMRCTEPGRVGMWSLFRSRMALLWVLLSSLGAAVHGQPFMPDFDEHTHTAHTIPNNLPAPIRPPPWLVPFLPENRSYAGLHNDLPALVKDRQHGNWIMVFDYTLGQRDFFLNVLYSYLVFGNASGTHFIVATASPGAFEDCLAMRLPCYNASHQYEWVAQQRGAHATLADDSHDRHHNYRTMAHLHLTWMKIKITLDVITLGCNIITTDNG